MKITYCSWLCNPRSSFYLVAQKHIKYLREKHGYNIVEVDGCNLRLLRLLPTDYVVLHPMFWSFYYCWDNRFELTYQLFKIRSTICSKIIAFETADSDMISKQAVEIANFLPDTIVVPSEYARRSFIRSGVNKPIKVVPHGVDNVFFSNGLSLSNPDLHRLYSINRKKILFFCIHSWYRKGMDLVDKALRKLRRKDYILVVKTHYGVESEYVRTRKFFKDIPVYHVDGWLREEEVRTLIDISDIVLVPSRGGGFELNGLEALIRNKPIVYPEMSCISEYAKPIIPELEVKVSNYPIVLPDNKIHVGRGHEVDIEDFTEKIEYALENTNELQEKIKEKFKNKEDFKWEKIVDKIVSEVLK